MANRSPELIPIEHNLDVLGRCYSALSLPLQTRATVKTALQEQWLTLYNEPVNCVIVNILQHCICDGSRNEHNPY